MTSQITKLAVSAALLAALAGCDDPAKNAPKATVSSATPAETQKAAAPAPTGAENLTIDPAASSVGFVGAKVTGSHTGKFEKFSGTARVVGDKIDKIELVIELESVKSDSDKLDGHLKSADFFDVAKYPKAMFSSTEIKAGGEKGATHTITGVLDLHGEKKTISFPATITVTPDAVTGTSEFAINRKDFKIVYPGQPDNLIKDEVALKLSLKAPRKKG
jgi:polyisoprenoid-binding protein YceI